MEQLNLGDFPKLDQQIRFILEVDKIKTIFRRNYLVSDSRLENDAEHSWHLGLMASLLEEYAEEPFDLLKVIKMVLMHDLVEIDAGDTYAYDTKGNEDKAEREEACAQRLFSMLPGPQRDEMFALFHEFEAMQTPESKYANAIDRIHPLLLNYYSGGKPWVENNICASQVYKRMAPIQTNTPRLWVIVEKIVTTAVAAGLLRNE